MRELFSANRIYRDSESGQQCIVRYSLRWDDIVDMCSGKGVDLPFDNTEPKTCLNLSGERTYWILARHADMKRRWEAYLQGETFLNDIPLSPN